MRNIAVFASGNGSDLQAIIDACQSGQLDAKVCAVISNNENAGALVRAKKHNIPAYHLSAKTHPEPAQLEQAVLDALTVNKTCLIFLAGYLRKIIPAVLATYAGQIYNIHPALLPKFGGKGMYGIHVHTAVLAAGETETGVTIHRVTTEYDKGTIVAQRTVPVLPDDTPETLAARVLQTEHVFIVEVLAEILNGGA